MKKSPKTSFFIAVLAAIVVVTLSPQGAAADEQCCLNNYRFAGGCMVVARGSETCASVLSYLNNFDSVGKNFCNNTTVRGGWTLGECSGGLYTQQKSLTPESVQPERIRQSESPIRSVEPQSAPSASEPNLMQVSAPLQVQFDSDLDTSTQGAGQVVTGTLKQDLMDGDTVIAPAGSQVQARVVPTSFWSDGSGDAYQIQATGIQVGDNVIPINGTAVPTQGEIATTGSQIKVPQGSMVSFTTAPADPSKADTPTFTANGKHWMEAFNNHDAESLAALYTQDAVLLPPNEPAVFGRDAIKADHQELFAMGNFKIDIEPLETVIDGQLAYVAGRYRMWTDDGDLVDRGKYIEIWRAVNGEWLIHRDMYNSSIEFAEAEENTD
jgi:uncharacterized protein (TIGR02246 family)